MPFIEANLAVRVVIYRGGSLGLLRALCALALAKHCFSDCVEHRVLLLEDEGSSPVAWCG